LNRVWLQRLVASWLLAAAAFALIWSIVVIQRLETRFDTLEAVLKQRLIEDAVAACNKEAEARGEKLRFYASSLPYAQLRLTRDPNGRAVATMEIYAEELVCEHGFAWPATLRRDPASPELD
jgi:hypothetical protein